MEKDIEETRLRVEQEAAFQKQTVADYQAKSQQAQQEQQQKAADEVAAQGMFGGVLGVIGGVIGAAENAVMPSHQEEEEEISPGGQEVIWLVFLSHTH